ncbi:hypothetical protein AB0A95_30590 [Micromonospora sp. NPDC049230]|uniref:hypothetical protein n=1 Tax=Micromonospora sp. NPDC049230 TaxID=3155502 RepID=UPI0033FB5BD3
MPKHEDRLEDTTASPLAPAAERGITDANERDDLPNPDTDTKQSTKDAKGDTSGK